MTSSSASQTSLKEGLRREFKARLAKIDPQAARRAADRAAEVLLSLPEIASARHVFTCLSFGLEIDTRRLIERLLRAGLRVYVPRAGRWDRRLYVHPYPCETKTLSFGLEEPRRGTPELAAERWNATLDVAVVLGLAFDHRGYRLGYGGGYFDRFLVGRPFPAIGLAYDQQLVDALPAEPHDVPMSAVVTEKGVRRFTCP